jgi:hypothetical protein
LPWSFWHLVVFCTLYFGRQQARQQHCCGFDRIPLARFLDLALFFALLITRSFGALCVVRRHVPIMTSLAPIPGVRPRPGGEPLRVWREAVRFRVRRRGCPGRRTS